jgi:Flp pilus assembly protein TadG
MPAALQRRSALRALRALGLRAKRRLRRFTRHTEGATTVEFAMVAAPFLALMFAIIETAIIFFAGQALESAVADSARLIMTGQAQTQALSQATFKQKVCARVFALFDCANGIYVDVRKSTSFSAADLSKPVDNQGQFQNNFVYQPGGPGDIVIVRIMYQWPVYVSLFSLNSTTSNMSGNKRLLMATAAFRNEPYQ